MGKPKVLMLGWEFPPRLTGGLGVAMEGLSHALSVHADLHVVLPRSNEQVETLPGGEPDAHSYARIAHYEQLSLSPGGMPDFYPYHGAWTGQDDDAVYGPDLRERVMDYARRTADYALAQEFDVIHAHDWLTFLPAMTLKAETGKPMLLHVHALETDRSGPEARNWVYALEKEAMQQADAILPVSEYTARSIQEHYEIPAEKIKPVHNAVEHIRPYRKTRHFPEKLVVFVGRMATQKGPHRFIEIAEKVMAQYPEVRFVMAGEGPLRYDLMAGVAAKALGDRIHFTGFLPREELFDLLAMADVFVMPSVSEPFGLAALEAAQFGVPCVLSQDSGAKEVLPDALVADSEDSDAMAAHVLKLLQDEAFHDQMGRWMESAASKLSWDHVALQVMESYRAASGAAVEPGADLMEK